LGTDKELPVGNVEEFIQSWAMPGRLVELEKFGNDYLKKFNVISHVP